MPRLLPFRFLLAFTLIFLGVGAAQAEPIQWSYSTWVFPGTIRPDVGPTNPNPVPTPLPYPIPYPPPPMWDAGVSVYGTGGEMADSARIVLSNLSTYGYLNPGEKVTFKNQPFQIGMGIVDKASNRSKVVMFTGYIDGSMTSQGGDLAISVAEQTKTLHIGKHLYKIDISGIVSPGAFGNGTGAIGASVKVSNNPEPSTLLLLGLGGPIAGFCYLRRRRINPKHAV